MLKWEGMTFPKEEERRWWCKSNTSVYCLDLSLSAVKFNAGVPHLTYFSICRPFLTTSPMVCMLACTQLKICCMLDIPELQGPFRAWWSFWRVVNGFVKVRPDLSWPDWVELAWQNWAGIFRGKKKVLFVCIIPLMLAETIFWKFVLERSKWL